MPGNTGKPKQQLVDSVTFTVCVLMNKLDTLFSQDIPGWSRHNQGFRVARLYKKEIQERHLTIYPYGWPKPSRVWCRFTLNLNKEWILENGEIIAAHIKLLCHGNYEFVLPFTCEFFVNEPALDFSIKPADANSPVANIMRNILARQRP